MMHADVFILVAGLAIAVLLWLGSQPATLPSPKLPQGQPMDYPN